ncbi:hypothetical protein BD413DRAFT_492170 [Trametes elegans]|nr:hypothetical protein BD413DRAFT_492170 [Trametes elegans]
MESSSYMLVGVFARAGAARQCGGGVARKGANELSSGGPFRQEAARVGAYLTEIRAYTPVPPSATVLKLRALVQKARMGPAPKLGSTSHTGRSATQGQWCRSTGRILSVSSTFTKAGELVEIWSTEGSCSPLRQSLYTVRSWQVPVRHSELMDEEAIDPTNPKQVEVFRNNI